MSKANNLTDFLTDIANAIRTKKGTSDLIDPQDFADEIANLATTPKLQKKSTSASATQPVMVKPDSGYDGLSQVQVSQVSNVYSGNIRRDQKILNIVGNYGPAWNQSLIGGFPLLISGHNHQLILSVGGDSESIAYGIQKKFEAYNETPNTSITFISVGEEINFSYDYAISILKLNVYSAIQAWNEDGLDSWIYLADVNNPDAGWEIVASDLDTGLEYVYIVIINGYAWLLALL